MLLPGYGLKKKILGKDSDGRSLGQVLLVSQSTDWDGGVVG